MRRIKRIVIFCFLLLLLSACKKDQHGCADKYSLNYDPSATQANHGTCLYARDSVSGHYMVTIVSYPMQASADGETDEWDISPCYTALGPTGQVVGINPLGGPLLSQPCVQLKGFSFTIADSNQVYWAGALLAGTGTFAKDSFHFSGVVTNSLGDTSILLLRGFKYY